MKSTRSLFRNLSFAALLFASLFQLSTNILADEEGGGWISGHEYTPPKLTTDGKMLAIDILGNLGASQAFDLIESSTVRTWLQKKIPELRQDIDYSPQRWSKSIANQSTCAETLPNPKSTIHFAWDKCAFSTKEDFARIYIQQSIRHLGILDNSFSKAISTELLLAWEKMKKTMIPTCGGSRGHLSKLLIGKWVFNQKVTNGQDRNDFGQRKNTLEFISDFSVTKVLPANGYCAIQAGYLSMGKFNSSQNEKIPFLLAEIEDKKTFTAFIINSVDHQIAYEFTIFQGKDPSKDELLISDIQEPWQITGYRRLKIASGNDHGYRPNCKPSIFRRCRTNR